jgi:hypothetical protein
MKGVRILISGAAIMLSAIAWSIVPARAQHQSGSQAPAAQPGSSAAAQRDEFDDRLGPFQIAGQNYTVVLHKKHLASTEDAPAIDGVVSMQIVDAAGTVLAQKTLRLWAGEDGKEAWSVVAGRLSGANGTGLLVKFGENIDTSVPDPNANSWFYSQFFGVVDGKFVPFGGPFGGILAKRDADGTFQTVRTPGSQADELRSPLCNGRFCFDVPVQIDWVQGKLVLPQQCAQPAGAARGMCQYQIEDPKKNLRRSGEVTFVRLYSSPDENSGRPQRVLVKPDSKIDFLAAEAAVEMKQVDISPAPSGADDPMRDRVQIQFIPNTEAWLQVRVDAKAGWVHSDEDLDAIGLPEAEDEVDCDCE